MPKPYGHEPCGGFYCGNVDTFTVTLCDTGLPYPDNESAQKDADEWAQGIADMENCMVAKVTVTEEDTSGA